MQNSPEARLANPFQNLLVGKPSKQIKVLSSEI
jgi:hypothetical protein